MTLSQRDLVLISFPFSDMKASKVRPAIVLSRDSYNRGSRDFIALPLTSNLRIREHAFLITSKDLEAGNLVVNSKVKVDRVFSVSQSLVRMSVGRVKSEVFGRLVESLLELISP